MSRFFLKHLPLLTSCGAAMLLTSGFLAYLLLDSEALADARSDAQARCEQKLGAGATAEEELDFGEVTYVCNCASLYQLNESNTRCVQQTSGQGLDFKTLKSAKEAPVHACDRLAAHPDDPKKKALGVPWEQLEKTADTAIEACKSAVADHQDEVRFKYQLGRALSAKKEHSKAAPLIREAAIAGYAAAMHADASNYQFGKGVTKSEKTAFLGFKAAAEKGFVQSKFALGILYAEGTGIEKSNEKAVVWFLEAAHAGHAGAMYELAILYREGLGVRQNYSKAVAWYRKAAALGNTDALYTLAVFHQAGLGVDKDFKRAAELMFQAVKRKNEIAIQEMTTNGAAAGNLFVIELQITLRLNGFYDGAIDGSFNPATKQAIKKLAGRAE